MHGVSRSAGRNKIPLNWNDLLSLIIVTFWASLASGIILISGHKVTVLRARTALLGGSNEFQVTTPGYVRSFIHCFAKTSNSAGTGIGVDRFGSFDFGLECGLSARD